MEVMIETCWGIDVHQKSIVCCILDGPLFGDSHNFLYAHNNFPEFRLYSLYLCRAHLVASTDNSKLNEPSRLFQEVNLVEILLKPFL